MTAKRRRVCVFCSTQLGHASTETQPNTAANAARELARVLHEHDIDLIYGGGSTGLMGELARERVRLGGVQSTIGVTPYALVEQERGKVGRDGVRKYLPFGAGSHKKDGGKDKKHADSGAGASVIDDEDIVHLPDDPQYGRCVGTPSLSRRKVFMMSLIREGAWNSGFLALPGGFGSFDEILEVITHRQLGFHRSPMILINVDGFWDGFVTWMDTAVERGFMNGESRSFVKVVASVDEAVMALDPYFVL